MANAIVLGMQWGDEGKGKIVDLLCPAFDAVVRYQGGNNAGHTVKFGDRHFALHLIPSGIVHEGMQCVLGNGLVVDPDALFEELDRLAESGVESAGRLLLSSRAHALLPVHVALDKAREAARGDQKIGTTARGIGPAYGSKAMRTGVRLGDLFSASFEERLASLVDAANLELEASGAEPVAIDALRARCEKWRERLEPLLADTAHTLNRWIDEGKSLLFEGAQGALLDLDHGTYPFVTSSSATAGGAATGSGVPPTRIDGVIGVLKAYTSRVGEGPFPTELLDEVGEHLQARGNEFGTTTGRPRRCGWLDAVSVRYARMINGVGTIALTKLDVLDAVEEIRLCTSYRVNGCEMREFPADLAQLAAAEPVYRTLPGWMEDTAGTLAFDDLPEKAREYVAAIEEEVGAPVGIVSTGPRREETLLRDEPLLGRLTSGRL